MFALLLLHQRSAVLVIIVQVLLLNCPLPKVFHLHLLMNLKPLDNTVWKSSFPKASKAADKSHAAFKLTPEGAIFNSSAPKTLTTGRTINSFGNKQHLIPLLDCPPFHI